jgi:hypothetical protein
MLPDNRVAQVKEQSKEELLALPNVVGVGVGFRTVGQSRLRKSVSWSWSATSCPWPPCRPKP